VKVSSHCLQSNYRLITGSVLDSSIEALTDWIDGQTAIVQEQLLALEQKRKLKVKEELSDVPVPIGAHAKSNGDGSEDKGSKGEGSEGTDHAPPGSEFAKPEFGIPKPPNPDVPGSQPELPNKGSDPWTMITLSFSAQDQAKTESESSWGFSVGGGFGWGLWSAGGAYSHEQSQKYDLLPQCIDSSH
jgi:hypothetical protein